MTPTPEKAAQRTVTMACTPENKAEFAAALARWPQAHALVKELHADGYITGLRNVVFRVTASDEKLAQGLGCIDFRGAAVGPVSGSCDQS